MNEPFFLYKFHFYKVFSLICFGVCSVVPKLIPFLHAHKRMNLANVSERFTNAFQMLQLAARNILFGSAISFFYLLFSDSVQLFSFAVCVCFRCDIYVKENHSRKQQNIVRVSVCVFQKIWSRERERKIGGTATISKAMCMKNIAERNRTQNRIENTLPFSRH